MYLCNQKDGDEFTVEVEFDREDKTKVFMGSFKLPQLRALARTLRSFIAAQPKPPLPDLNGFDDKQLAEAYIALRDRKQEAGRATKKIDAGYKAALDSIATEFVKRFNERKVKSTAIEGLCTVARSTAMKPSSGDWKITYNFLIDEAIRLRSEGKDATEVFAYLQKRLVVEPIQKYAEEHDGAVPPGVNVLKEYSVRVTRAGGKAGKDEDDDE